MKTILSFLFVFTAVAGFAQQCHEFIIRTESVASNFSGGGCGYMPLRDDADDKESTYESPPTKSFYIALYKPYQFVKASVGTRDVAMHTVSRVNDTLLAFTKLEGQDVRNKMFTAEYREKGKIKTMRVRLVRCDMSTDAENNEVYHVCKECLEPEQKMKGKGFFAWVGRLFG